MGLLVKAISLVKNNISPMVLNGYHNFFCAFVGEKNRKRGVCLSDMIPFYIGKLFRQSGASDDVCSKLGIGKEKALSITQAVQKYGNLSGFVERFSVGMRNPTAFFAGALVSLLRN
jgi:hypothetical protein